MSYRRTARKAESNLRPISATIGSATSRIAVAAVMAAGLCNAALAQHEASPTPSQPSAEAQAPASTAPTETIVVTGSRIAREGFTAPSPVTVVGTEAIQAFGTTNVAETLSELPSFRASQSPENTFVTLNGNLGARTLDLRGLAPQRTLVLVNSRRFVPSSSQGTVDINLIPTSLIRSVEVVTGGASAAYGSDAVAGVVNFLLDTDLEGVRGNAQYGISDRGDDEEWMLGLAAGTNFADGRGHVIAGGEYADNKGVGGCFTLPYCAEEYSNFTNTDWPNNGLPNRVTLPHKHATLTGGGLINSGPLRGTKFLPDGTPAEFEYGMWPSTFAMVGGEGHLGDPFTTAHYMKAPVERYSLYGMATFDFTNDLSAFLEASFGKVIGNARGAQTRDISITIQRDNPYIPEEVQQRMDEEGLSRFVLARAGDDFGVARYHAENRTFRIVGGLEGRVADFADWNVYYQYGDNKYDQTMDNNRIQSRFPLAVDAVARPDGTVICRSSLADPGNGCIPVNLFGEFNWTQGAKDYLYGSGWQTTAIEQHVIAANLQAEPFSTWAGPVSLAVGGEYRDESIAGEADPISQQNGWYVGNGQSVRGGIDVKEAYAETVIPLAEDLPFARMLEVNGAIRLTDYSTSGTVTTWKLGLVYEPTDWLRLRATRSRDIRAPNLHELFGATSSAFSRVVDTDGVQYLPQVFTGGNAELQPESADTWTAGVVLTPESLLPGLRLSADYYDIQVNDAISQVGAQTTVDRCAAGVDQFCGLVTREGDGTISAVRNPWLNLDTLIIRGVDFEAAYATSIFDTARLSLRVLASYVDDYITIDSVGAIDRAGQTGVQTGALPGMPDWSGNATMTLEQGPARVSLAGRFINSGIMDVTLVGPTDKGYDPSLPNSISDNHLPSRIYVDLGIGYKLLDNGDRSVEFYGAIENLFDKNPPINVYSGSGTNPFLFDTILRRFTAGIRFSY